MNALKIVMVIGIPHYLYICIMYIHTPHVSHVYIQYT